MDKILKFKEIIEKLDPEKTQTFFSSSIEKGEESLKLLEKIVPNNFLPKFNITLDVNGNLVLKKSFNQIYKKIILNEN